jgi:hypothetical protein
MANANVARGLGVNCLFVSGVLCALFSLAAGSTGLGPNGQETACFTKCTSFSPDLPAGCQRAPPAGLAFRDKPLWMYKGWTSLDQTSMMTKILIRDILGYKNVSWTSSVAALLST